MKKEHDEIAAIKRAEVYGKVWYGKALELIDNLKINPGAIMDIGAGKGEFLELVRESFYWN